MTAAARAGYRQVIHITAGYGHVQLPGFDRQRCSAEEVIRRGNCTVAIGEVNIAESHIGRIQHEAFVQAAVFAPARRCM